MLYDWETLSDTGPRKLVRDRDLAVFLLTPGFSNAYLGQALAVSNATLWKYVKWARDLALTDPMIAKRLSDNLASISAEDGWKMASRRGKAHLPYWSRLAISHYLEAHRSATYVAKMFGCSTRTIYNVQRGNSRAYNALTCERQLSVTQAQPSLTRTRRLADVTKLARGLP